MVLSRVGSSTQLTLVDAKAKLEQDLNLWLLETYGIGYCLAPSERILTADLQWVPCGELKEGTKLAAFDEELQLDIHNRRWKTSIVTYSQLDKGDCVRIELDNGHSIICTSNHPWLAKANTKYGQEYRWIEAKNLIGCSVARLTDTWETNESYESGWLAGMFDGEGYLTQDKQVLGITQNPGDILDLICYRLMNQGFNINVYNSPGKASDIKIAGSWAEKLRCLGTLRPSRLLNKLPLFLPNHGIRAIEKPKVIAITMLGEQPIQRISTSSGTYIGEGYAMHNTTPSFGSIIETFIGQYDPPTLLPAVQQEVQRILSLYQTYQTNLLKTSQSRNQLSNWYKDQVIQSINSVSSTSQGTQITVTVLITTLAGTQFPINLQLSSTGLNVI